MAAAIRDGEVSDDDIKVVDQACAKAIKTGKAPKRVGASTAALIGKRPKKRKEDLKAKRSTILSA